MLTQCMSVLLQHRHFTLVCLIVSQIYHERMSIVDVLKFTMCHIANKMNRFIIIILQSWAEVLWNNSIRLIL